MSEIKGIQIKVATTHTVISHIQITFFFFISFDNLAHFVIINTKQLKNIGLVIFKPTTRLLQQLKIKSASSGFQLGNVGK